MTINVTPIPRLIDLATPAWTLGTANAAGSAVTAVASDATLLAFDTTLPAAVGSAATGSAVTAARRDHVHAGITSATLLTYVMNGTRTASAGAGTQAITGANFAPAGAIAFGTKDGTPLMASWGFADDADASKELNVSSASGNYNINTIKFIEVGDGAGNYLNCTVTMEDDGVELTWAKGGTGQNTNWTIIMFGVGTA